MRDVSRGCRHREQNDEFIDLRRVEGPGEAARAVARKAEKRHQARQTHRDDDDADGLHDGDRAHIGFDLDGNRHYL